MPSITISEFQNTIRTYYQHNARSFPWRETADPYAIFLSEVMLQQTQTSRVIEKYQSFLRHYPTVTHLAGAPQSEVLQLWQGLGI